ncbi:lipoteichoic acid synthase [Peribacillus deserti]|uniref:Lipoteichoic acid synthase n=1 Tax=Peribacillus deserti TaxID=673318 RepID=A0ABS2QMZ0_9BACI|nr:LTA synthase family protein [Peribacillus deserti]MBM7694124.1 lipoteichoic acid synthase [Peribacillus deserti]
MESMKKIGSKLYNNKLSFFYLAVFLFWIKTYAAYKNEFNLGISNDIQEFLLFINPISSGLFFFAFALLRKGRARNRILITINFVLSFILYANIAYYRFFNDFITLPVLTQTKNNAGDLGNSIAALIHPADIFYFLDTIILILLLVFKKVKPATEEKLKARTVLGVFASAVLVFLINLGLAETDRPELLTRTFDRNYLVKYLGTYNYTIYDMIQSTKSSAQRALADSDQITEVENNIKSSYAEPNEKYFGKAEGMNVVYISLESLQSFIIDYKLEGQEVTPFLNSLTRDKNTFYFKNFFHQTGQGKTSDAEFMMENSLYPLPQGAVFTTKAQNTYQALPGILKTKGYTSAVFHGNYKTFWNREEMYKSFGYDKFFDANYYNMSEENTINYGMEDKPFFKESIPLMQGLQQPFYGKFITLSNHFPFNMDPEDITFPAAKTDDKVVNQYFQTAHYMDQALQQFFSDLKASGLYDNTMVVMYGDHYGISENHNDAMSEVMGKEITNFENTQLQRVPFFIHVPGVQGNAIDKFSGDVDVRPTVMHLLGIDTKDYLEFGSDILSNDFEQIVPFRNGDFVTPQFTEVDGKCYDNTTGEVIDGEACKAFGDKANSELELSDKVVYGDLLRFYQPDGFKKINPADYDYSYPEKRVNE